MQLPQITIDNVIYALDSTTIPTRIKFAESEKSITISLRRIISRLNVALSVDEEVDKADLGLAI